jgi:hypothetical protein
MRADKPDGYRNASDQSPDSLQRQIEVPDGETETCSHDWTHQRRNQHRANDDRRAILN